MTFENILIIDDNCSSRGALEDHLHKQNYSVVTAGTLFEAAAMMESGQFDLVFLDLSLPDGNPLEFLERMAPCWKQSMAVILGSRGGAKEAIECIRAGAFDYLSNPLDPDEVDSVIRRAESQWQAVRVKRYLEEERRCEPGLPGASPAAMQMRALVQRAALSELPVLISGECGVGKERLARAIHSIGSRAHIPPIRVNCAAGSEQFIERELFGNGTQGEGRLELASGGTLLLESVSDLPLRLQGRLLEAMQKGELERSNGRKPVKIDVRIIATATRDLSEAVERGWFRQDLFLLLSAFSLRVPALRERICDLPALAQAWLEKDARRNGFSTAINISEEALRHLMAYSWPGNVRELENVLERAVIVTGFGCRIEADAFEFLHVRRGTAVLESRSVLTQSEEAPPSDPHIPLLTLDELEKRQVLRALEYTNQNRTRAAALLQISVRTLRNKLHRYRSEAGAEAKQMPVPPGGAWPRA